MDDSCYAATISFPHTCAHSRSVFFNSVPPKPSKDCVHVAFARVTARSIALITRSESAKADDWHVSPAPFHISAKKIVCAVGMARARFSLAGGNLRCVFCQNFETSQFGEGAEVNASELAGIMLGLQEIGCHNINFVTPEHVVPQILEALVIAVERGLRLPLVYNTSAYDSLESIRWMDGVVDIYMPDFKLWDAEHCRKYLVATNYAEAARSVIAAMHAQVGELKVDVNGLALRGVLVRHLVMPGLLADTRQIMRWIAENLSPDTYVNVMDQYYPAYKAETEPRFAEINRRISDHEFCSALELARDAGLWRVDTRWRNVIPHGAPIWLPRARSREAPAR
jgi:putative pyruvate formate lyase activating enzyme